MPSERKSLMRCLGEFVGHVVRGVKSKPSATSASGTSRREVRREEQVEHRPGVTLRRTVIEEIECHDDRP